VRRRLVRAAEERAPGLRTARIRSEGPVVDGTVVPDEPARPHIVIEGGEGGVEPPGRRAS